MDIDPLEIDWACEENVLSAIHIVKSIFEIVTYSWILYFGTLESQKEDLSYAADNVHGHLNHDVRVI